MDSLNGFDAVAGYYDRLAQLVFGRAIMRAQTEFLSHLKDSTHVLVLGGGSGWWLKNFLLIKPDCQILFVEPSRKMLDLAMKYSGHDQRIQFLQGTADSIVESRFDAVLTFFVLDLFTEAGLGSFIGKVRGLLGGDATWLVSDFVDGKWWHRVLLSIMYSFFGLAVGLKNRGLPEWERAMEQAGFELRYQKMFYGNFIKSALYKPRGH